MHALVLRTVIIKACKYSKISYDMTDISLFTLCLYCPETSDDNCCMVQSYGPRQQ